MKKEDANFPLFVGTEKYICLLASSKIEIIENNSVPALTFNFVPINEIESLEASSKCGNFQSHYQFAIVFHIYFSQMSLLSLQRIGERKWWEKTKQNVICL